MRGVVIPWLLKLLVGLGLLGLAALETGAVVAARVGVEGDANHLALEAAALWSSHSDPQALTGALQSMAAATEAKVIQVKAEGGFVSVTVERQARTQLIHRIPILTGFTRARTTAVAEIR